MVVTFDAAPSPAPLYLGPSSIALPGIAMLRPIHCILAFSLAALLLAGCGNKGDLVLPDQQPKKHKKSQPATPATPAKTPETKPAEPSSGGSEPVH
jgi:predicted small lipoprotein YifL